MLRTSALLAALLVACPLAADLTTVADLAARVGETDPTPVVTEALKGGPMMRATAARIAAVRGLKPVLPALREALAAETDADTAREELRALILLGTDEDVALAVKTAAKYPPRMDAAVADAIARLGPPRATDLYLATVRNLRHISDETNFFTLALWGHRELLTPTAARVLGSADARGWRELLSAADDAQVPVAPTVLSAAFGSSQPAIREVTLLTVAQKEGLPEPMVIEAAAKPGPEGATTLEIFGRELVRRKGGGERHSDPRFVAYLATPEGIRIGRLLPTNLLTAEERSAVPKEKENWITMKVPDGEKALPPAPFDLPSPLPPGLVDAILSSSLCSGGWFGLIGAAVDPAGRLTQLDIGRVNVSVACRAVLDSAIRLSLAQPASFLSPFVTHDIVVLRPNRASMCLDDTSVAAPGPPGRIAYPGGDLKPPVVERRIEPTYPEAARRQGMASQIVIVEAIISRTGCIRNLRLVKPAPSRELNTSAILAVSQWIFQPATIDGIPVPVRFNLTVNFRL